MTRSIAAEADEPRRLEVFQAIRLQRATDEVCIAILDPLRSGVFTVGDRLPREKDLAERFEVSVHTVSEALRILEQAGIVRQRRGRYGGTYVVSLANVRSVLASMLASSHSDSQAELRNLLELRRPLELQAALLTAERAGEEHVLQLRRIADALDPDLPVAEFRPRMSSSISTSARRAGTRGCAITSVTTSTSISRCATASRSSTCNAMPPSRPSMFTSKRSPAVTASASWRRPTSIWAASRSCSWASGSSSPESTI